jgi:hypothetical protein
MLSASSSGLNAHTSSNSTPGAAHQVRTAAELIPPAIHLRAFNLLDASGRLKSKPCAVHCAQCSQREESEGKGMLLCVKIADGSGNTVICYYHSKGKDRDQKPRGRWFLACLLPGARSRVVCDRGHACDIVA